MAVYFIRSSVGGEFKIGWTEGNPYSRLAALQTGNPHVLELVVAIRGGRRDETELHKRFAAHRIGTGEWFKPHAELVGFVDGLHRAQRDVPFQTDDHIVPCNRRSMGLDLAEVLSEWIAGADHRVASVYVQELVWNVHERSTAEQWASFSASVSKVLADADAIRATGENL